MSDWQDPYPADESEQTPLSEAEQPNDSAGDRPQGYGALSDVDAGLVPADQAPQGPTSSNKPESDPEQTVSPEPAPSSMSDEEAKTVTSLVEAIESRMEEVRRLGEDMHKRESSMTERVVDLDRKSAEMSAKMAALDAERSQLAAKESALREQSESLTKKENEIQRRMEEAEARLSSIEAREAELASQDADLCSRAQSLESQASTVREQDESIASREQAIDGRAHAVEEAEREIESLKAELASEREKIREMAVKLKQEHAALTEMKSAALEDNDRSLEERERDLAQLRASLDIEHQRLEEQWREFEAQKAGLLDGSTPALTSFEQQQQFEDRERELEESMASVSNERERLEAMAQQLQIDREEIKRERSACEGDRDRGAAMAAIGAAMDKTIQECQIRRERLRGVHSALKIREEKLHKAREIIRGRHKECERILAMRDRVTKAQEEVEAEREAVTRQADRSRVAGVMLKLVIAVAVLGGLSWAVADRIAPTTDLVRATIAAQGVTAEEDIAKDWNFYGESLSMDPRLIEETAARLKRRGVEELGSPGPLAAYFKDSLNIDSQRPGELNIALKGPGGGATQRVLETYLASFVAIANDATGQVAGQPSTVVSVNAKVDGPPLTDDRLQWAGVMWGSSTLLLMLIGWALWSRLAAATRRTEVAGASAFGVG